MADEKFISSLIKVKLADFYKMVNILEESDVSKKLLTNIYMKKLVDHSNQKIYSPMIKSYFETGIELYNLFSCCILIKNMNVCDFDNKLYEIDISHINDFVWFAEDNE